MKRAQYILNQVLSVFALILFLVHVAPAQTEYRLHIASIYIPDGREKTWYGRPTENDFIVSWDLYAINNDGEQQLVDSVGVLEYRVFMSLEDSTFQNVQTMDVANADTTRFTSNKINKRYYFRIDGLKDGNVIVQSDTAWALGGRPKYFAQNEPPKVTDKNSFLIPLFFPVAELVNLLFHRQNEIYTHSTSLGRASFTLIWYFFFLGIYIIASRSMPRLYLGNLFPFTKMNSFKAHFNKDQNYETCISPRLRFIIEAWKRVIIKTNTLVKDSKAATVADIEQMCFEHFRKFGLPALEVLRKIISFNPTTGNRQELTKEVEKYFGQDGEFGDIINKPFIEGITCNNAPLAWHTVENDLFNPNSASMADLPTVKILAAGLENHLINGHNWQHVSEEVDRAVGNRAASEIESLHEKSSLDWLWNLGAMAPLLGLFGTVTGISKVFKDIKVLPSDTTQVEMVNKLSGGIFEALYTTIYGLIAGIILMLFYYYFTNSLEWIKNKWQSLFVHVTERL